MKPAALGFCMHSGWGVLVAVSGSFESPEILKSEKIVVIDAGMAGGKQPYHHMQAMALPQAEKFLAEYTLACHRQAKAALAASLKDLALIGYRAIGAGLLLASGRVLPPLEKILAAHPLIHTAEGELFRDVVRQACEALDLRVNGYRQRDLPRLVKDSFGRKAEPVIATIAAAGKKFGPPWTADHKSAAQAACLALQHSLVATE